MSIKRTPGGIARPESGPYSHHTIARTVAKDLNAAKGRGYRALRAQDGNHAVIFRPAVANNRQRRVRTIGA